MKIAFFELEDWEENSIREALAGHELHLSQEKIDEDTLPPERNFAIVSVFVDSRLTEKVVTALPNLRLVATRSTGYDHLDLSALRRRKIAAAYVPGYGDNTVAEFAFGLLLSLMRKIYQGIDQIKETGSFSSSGLRGIDLKDKTLGVIGTGRIGRETIKIAKGFGMKVVASDPFPDERLAEEAGFEYKPLEQLLARSDAITIHCPLSPGTHHLINQENVKLIKRGAYLINTARGGIVETVALVHALKEGILAGAGLDVLEEEREIKDELEFLSKGYADPEELKTLVANHVLMKMPNVLITPHNAFNSQEALKRILDMTIGNINAFIGGKPVNLVKQ